MQTVIVHFTNVSALLRQLKALHDWVGERLNDCTVGAEQSNNRIEHAAWIDMQGCFNKTKKKMRTLFAGLIDFDS